MKFTLEIELGNDSMQTRRHVAGALVQIGERIAETDPGASFAPEYVGLDFAIRDHNGNTVGSWKVIDNAAVTDG